MLKFKILRWALKIFICLCILGISSNMYIIYLSNSEDIPLVKMEITSFFISTATILLLTTSLFFIHQSFTSFLKKSFFNLESASHLTKGGYLLAITGLMCFTIDMTKLSTISQYTFIVNTSTNCLLLIVGFGITAIADIIVKGENIKRENDLTI
ncbi:hypothetical protein D3C87_588890 [compost metagenome]